jgi:hypothetical protein
MHGLRIALVLSVFGSAMLFGCGGKSSGVSGGAASGGSAGSNPPAEPGDYEPPPPTFEPPPPTYEPPPPIVSGTGSASAACVELCNFAASRTCQGQMPSADEIAACPGECTTAFSEFGSCEDEFLTLLSCVLRSPQFDDLFDQICEGGEIGEIDEEELARVCYGPALAFSQCSDNAPPEGSCESEAGCDCDTACESCECLYGFGSPICDSTCGGGAQD